ncbi:hybrid sensor histidine kinase/response regulator transcription factor [Flavobacterium seoulense]|uniref:histidine kinase n=1 Tax=Flavobacterium seoulense TaxID=1492738 RepID=A0A066WPA9_9FLAO|nr:hybrid sensor histidine kinase/response regulator transcription factor [Flavobacterium seoulense]KDN55867.1 Response regulator receiver domain protein, putative transcriptional regulator [Flavobacterium seoulense]
MSKKSIIIVFFYLISVFCKAQPFGALTHFSHNVNLSQSIILDIQQDKKGFIWLGTYNGLYRYDGISFQKFKVLENDSLNLKSNRVYSFKFDKNGRIWINSKKNDIYYFDTNSLSFHHPLENKLYSSSDISLIHYKIMSSGRVWLFPKDKNFLMILETNKQIRRIYFNAQKLSVKKIKDVFEDSTGTTWFLTSSGVCRLKKSELLPEYFFFNNSRVSGGAYPFNCVVETKNEIWFGGFQGKLTYYSKKLERFFDIQLAVKEDVNRIKPLAGDKLFILTDSKSFYCYDINTRKLDIYNSKTVPGFPEGAINHIGLSRQRQFWFQTSKSGLCKFDFVSKKLKYMSVESNYSTVSNTEQKEFLFTDAKGNVWIQSKRTPFAYWDESQDRLFSIAKFMKEPREEVSDLMHSAMFDATGNLWFCSFKQGLDMMSFSSRNFSVLDLGSSKDQKHNVRSLMKDKNGNLWVASRSNKITLLDSKKKKIGLLGADGTLSSNSPGWGADIYNMIQDTKGRIWIGTKGNGLFCLLPTEKPFTYKVNHYKFSEKDIYSISSDNIYKIFEASSGRIYIATWGGGVNIIRQSSSELRFINYRNELKKYPIKSASKVRSIVENKEHKMFFISYDKLFSFSENNIFTDKVRFKEFPEISGNEILDILVTSNNSIVLGTNGEGLILANLDKEGKLKIKPVCSETTPFLIQGIISIQEDKSGKIWAAGDNQIVRFDLEKNSAETFSEIKSLIGNEIFSEATKCLLPNGEIVLGYSSGAVIFNPKKITPFQFKPYLALTSFSVNNKELYEINQETPKNTDLLKEISLEHDQNFFKVQFSALDYLKNENIVYRYKLEGIDKGWNYIKGVQSINYTNLSKGEYELVISSTNHRNLWVNNERRIKINVLPSMWNSNFAYFCYLLLAIGLFLLAKHIFLTILKLRNDVQMQEQIAELKLDFFTDISHEIRTPLTMITAPVEKMLLDDKVADSVKTELRLMERNTNKLLNLVNQILDLRRIQNRKLEVQKIDLGKFCNKICESFRAISLQKKIRLELKTNISNSNIWADAESLDKILVNLISNALKYCREGDTIEVVVEESETEVLLVVKDNGPGINSSIQKRLFTRFSNYNENPNNPSTGIGLSIVKDLLDQHSASIIVDTEPLKGSCFQISFQKGYEHFKKDVNIVFHDCEHNEYDLINDIENDVDSVDLNEVKKDKVVGLIVEDDPELREFIVSIFDNNYTIHTAENGVEGQLKAISLSPDFIISDIMMPQMDGVEMLRLLRNNIASSHIPIILLSAKTSIESKLKGIQYGADEYLSKPFNVSYLKARVKNILEQRKRLQLFYSSGNITESTIEEPLAISEQDHKFMFEVIQQVKDNLSNTDFSVDELGKLMGMSRTSFFNKLKNLTGISPLIFIRDIRLNIAAERIKKEDLLIKEICFEVGFSDLKYFRKCFKEKFNSTPAEYRNL